MGNLAPQGMSYFETAPIRSVASLECPAPADTVFAVIADHRRWPEWIGMGVSSVEPTSQPESGIGSTRTLTFSGGLLRVEEKFIAWDAPTRWAFTGVDCSPKIFRKLVEGFWLEPIDAGRTAITYRMGCELPTLMKPLSPVFGPLWTFTIRKAALPKLSAAAVKRHRGEGIGGR